MLFMLKVLLDVRCMQGVVPAIAVSCYWGNIISQG